MKSDIPVQVITQANDCWLLPREYTRTAVDAALTLGADIAKTPIYEKTGLPEPKAIYIGPDLFPASFTGTTKKQSEVPYIQKLRIRHYDLNGYGVRLFEGFIGLNSRNELERFVESNQFSIFPNEDESFDLLERYKEVGILEVPRYIAKVRDGTRFDPRLTGDSKKRRLAIYEVNLDYIWKKQQALKMIAALFATGELPYHKLHQLNNGLENTSDILIDKNHRIFEESTWTKKEHVEKDVRTKEEILGLSHIRTRDIIATKRFYGHYGLCYFVLKEMILSRSNLDRENMSTCANPECVRPFVPRRAGHVYCNNPDCMAMRNRAKSKRNYRNRSPDA